MHGKADFVETVMNSSSLLLRLFTIKQRWVDWQVLKSAIARGLELKQRSSDKTEDHETKQVRWKCDEPISSSTLWVEELHRPALTPLPAKEHRRYCHSSTAA